MLLQSSQAYLIYRKKIKNSERWLSLLKTGGEEAGKPETLRVKPGGSPKPRAVLCSREPKNPRREAGGFSVPQSPTPDSPFLLFGQRMFYSNKNADQSNSSF